MKALLLENVHPDAERILTDRGYEVEVQTEALPPEALSEALAGVSLLGIRSATHVTAEVIAANPKLQAVGAFCIGTNQIDLNAASDAGLAVFNAPFSNTRSVVELTLAEIIALARRLVDKNRGLHEGVWDKSASGSHEVRGRTLGIVGYGNIGSQLSVLAEALGMRVIFYDIVDKLALGNARRCETLEELLAEAEVVSLHVDGRPGNAGIFTAVEFAKMRPRALFLNLCRGIVVDLEALRDALVSGRLAGAAIDVFPNEPHANTQAFSSPLQGLPNVILTPHVGGSTQEAQRDIGRFVATKLGDYASIGSTVLSVNLPQVQNAPSGTTRILHLHRNVPGVLARLNAVIGDHDVNIAGQVLGTRGTLGYVITDLDDDGHENLVDELEALPETVRVRTVTL
ncbi:MAG: phosphoglycerate dehydrogenase [Propionibacteriaceae bacterium]